VYLILIGDDHNMIDVGTLNKNIDGALEYRTTPDSSKNFILIAAESRSFSGGKYQSVNDHSSKTSAVH
jgi:hypothetical protein